MNEYTECIYNTILENYFSSIITTPDYQTARAAYDMAEKAFLETLSPEQKKQFERCKDLENTMQEINLKYMFQKTLHFLRGIFCR